MSLGEAFRRKEHICSQRKRDPELPAGEQEPGFGNPSNEQRKGRFETPNKIQRERNER